MRRPFLIVAAVAGIAVGAGSYAFVEAGNTLNACGMPSDAPVTATFTVATAQDIWKHLPAMGRSPELEVDQAATVIVCGADVTAPIMGGAMGKARPNTLHDAVCVILADGTPILYHNVSRSGFKDT